MQLCIARGRFADMAIEDYITSKGRSEADQRVRSVVLRRTTAMAHLLARHPLPHVNIALIVALVWVALAVAAAIYDVGHMMQAW
jgi:hypothetical protein